MAFFSRLFYPLPRLLFRRLYVFSSFLQHNANYVVKETKMKSKKYVAPETAPVMMQTERILEDSNEGDWMPLNIVIPDDSSVK